MDNRIFNVNGREDDDLLEVLKLAFKHGNWNKERKAKGWRIDKKYGFILFSYIPTYTYTGKNINEFPIPLSAEAICPIIKEYLKNKETWENVEFEDWDKDLDHDGSNGKGWRVYCENWGHIDSESSAFIAIKPAYMWFGK